MLRLTDARLLLAALGLLFAAAAAVLSGALGGPCEEAVEEEVLTLEPEDEPVPVFGLRTNFRAKRRGRSVGPSSTKVNMSMAVVVHARRRGGLVEREVHWLNLRARKVALLLVAV